MTVGVRGRTATVYGPEGNTSVALVGDADVISAVAELAAPWLTVVEGSADARHTIVTGPAHAPRRARQIVENAPDDEPPRRIHVSHSAHEIVVDAGEFDWQVMQVMRSIRHLLRWLAFDESHLFLHGGMVAFDGDGVAFVGAKRSGKTSLVMTALACGAEFVVNDDLTLVANDGEVTGYGWPRTVAVRRDSVLALSGRFPGFARSFRTLRHPANRWNVDVLKAETIEGMAPLLWVDPTELTAASGSVPRRSARLRAVVLPSFDDTVTKPELELLDPHAAEAELAPHVEQSAVNYDPFLAGWFPTAVPGGDSVRQALSALPVYRLRQRMELLPHSVQTIRDVLRHQHAHHDEKS
jgi:hypothetical protein